MGLEYLYTSDLEFVILYVLQICKNMQHMKMNFRFNNPKKSSTLTDFSVFSRQDIIRSPVGCRVLIFEVRSHEVT